ncbi:hypothetical protein AB0K51_31165 [Kitasatospora sp. NPDC049285]|uniref:hypothetical protein n=1 Tax=Kitasatospora sp. NPDC049285 TaxID=3157096 RepID=UPI0034180895
MRTALTAQALTALALVAAVLLPAGSAAAAEPVPDQGYSIPVGAITDLGALPVLATLGNDFAHLLGK